MGKRKSGRAPQGPKKREGLPTSFKCVFCDNENSVSVKIERKSKIATLSCRDCNQNFQTANVHNLTQPVDVHYEWIDACEQVARDHSAATAYEATPSRPAHPHAHAQARRAGPAEHDDYDQEDGFIDDEGVEAEADYENDE